MAKNLARSSSGTRSLSLARSRTRLLKASQDSSRSKNRSAGRGSVGKGSVAPLLDRH